MIASSSVAQNYSTLEPATFVLGHLSAALIKLARVPGVSAFHN